MSTTRRVPEIRFDAVLAPQDLERKLRGAHPYLKAQGYADGVREHGLQFDLSKVEYADFGALAQLLLLVEGAMRRGIAVWIALPLDRMRLGEEGWIERLAHEPRWQFQQRQVIEARVNRRRGAMSFMRNCGFVSALSCSHVDAASKLLTVELEYDRSSARRHTEAADDEEVNAAEDLETTTTVRPRNIVPFHWVTAGDETTRERYDREVVRLLTLRGVALSTSDAQAVGRVVLRELLDNVADHAAEGDGVSCPPAGLIGGVVIRHFRPGTAATGDREITRPHADWLQSTGAPVIRLVVGDSGRGICATLPLDDHDPQADGSADSRTWSGNERILLQAMSPWSTRRSSSRTSLGGVRGLASVRRVVGEASGAIVFRAADAVAGYVYPPGGRRRVGRAGLSYVPGTLVDVVLAPTAAPRALLARPAHGPEATVVTMQRLLEHRDGSCDVTPIMHELRRGHHADDRSVVVLIWSVPVSPQRRYRLCMSVLSLAEELSSDGMALVLLTPDQSAPGLSAQLREVDDMREQDPAAKPVGTPVMVLDERGDATWLGISSPQRRLLGAIGDSLEMSIRRDSLGDILSRAPEAANALVAQLSGWLVVEEERVGLRLPPQTLVSAALAHAQAVIGDAAFATTRTAAAGAVLVTPTLAETDRWIDAQLVISRVGGAQVAGQLLGLHMAPALAGIAREDVSVACIGRVPEASLRAFVTALGAQGRTFRLTGEVGLSDDPGAPFVRADTTLVCVTDLMLTANHVRHAINDLVRAGARPKAVGTFIDGRAPSTAAPAFGQDLPVHALVTIPLAVDGAGRSPDPVEPVSTPSGFVAPPQPPLPPIKDEEIMGWCENVDNTLLTGHIARLARRHFFSFLDVSRLLDDATARDRVKEEIRVCLNGWLEEAGANRPDALWILYPGGPSDRAARFARLVEETLGHDAGTPRLAGSTGIERVARAGRNVLSVPIRRVPPNTGVVVVDWGAVTLHTTQELLHIAGDIGADHVLALILSSQLTPEDEVVASHVRAIHGTVPEAAAQLSFDEPTTRRLAATRPVPTRIRFLSSFPVGYSNAAECSVCALARDYAQFAATAPAKILRSHAERMAAVLEPEELDGARTEGAKDSLGTSLPPGSATDILRIRRRLARAQLSTSERVKLAKLLRQPDGPFLDSLVRVLTLEPRWLKSAPLRFFALREQLAEALVEQLKTPQPIALSRQYAIALRATSKEHYLDAFPTLLTVALQRTDGAPMVGDLLLGIYTLLKRPYHSNTGDRTGFRRALKLATSAVRDRPELLSKEIGLDAVEAMATMGAELEYASGSQHGSSLSPHDAWLQLRTDYYEPVIGHRHDLHLSSLEAAVRIESLQEADEWRDVVDEWQPIQRFLAGSVLPNLPSVADVILASLGDRQAPDEDSFRFRRLLGLDGLRDLAEIGQLLTAFAALPERALAQQAEITHRLDWWWRFFFRDSGGLLRILADCPCDVAKEARRAASTFALNTTERPIDGPDFHSSGSAEAFCHPWVVRQVTQHLIRNASEEKHSSLSSPAGSPVRVAVQVSGQPGYVALTVMNDGTRVTPGSGRGLLTNRRLLEAYGGELNVETPSRSWTYQITALFPRW